MATRETRTTTFDEATLRARRAKQRELERRRRLAYPSAWQDPGYYADPRNAHTATWLTSRAAQDPNGDAFWYREQLNAAASMLTENQADALRTYLNGGVTSPGLAAGVADVARQLQLDPETMQAIQTLDATYAAMAGEGAPEQEQQGSEAEKGRLARTFGNITRPVFSLLSMPFEMVYGSIREIVGTAQEEGWSGIADMATESRFEELWQQSLGGQYIRGLIDPNYSSDLGEGWFPGGDVHARQVQAARSAAPLVHGRAWTPGRGVSSLFIDDPDSRTYRNVSGFIDLVSNVVLDPLVLVGGTGQAARASQRGARTAEGVRISETARAGAAEAALRQPETWLAPREVIRAATEHVRDATKSFTEAQKANGQAMAATRLATASDRYNDAADRLALARSDAIYAPTRTTLSTAEVNARVSNALGELTPEAVGAISSKITRDAPDLPGVITDALPAQRSSLVGAHDGVDAIVTSTKDRLLTVSVDDALDAEHLIGTLKKSKAPKAIKAKAIETLQGLRERPTYGDLIERAAQNHTAGTVASGLRDEGIDAVTDIFRLGEGEGGVWWTTADMDVVRWADGSWKHIDPTEAAATQRVKDLEAAQRSAAAQRGKATQDANVAKRVAIENADYYGRVMDGLTDMSNAPVAVRSAVEYSLGVRRKLGGKPDLDHTAVKEFFFGTPTSFDQAIGATATKGQKVAKAADRAMLGAVTLGGSEAVRAAARAAQPLLVKARKQILGDMVRLEDTAENLGRLHRLTRGKMDPQALRAALRANSEEEVLEALAPQMGVTVTRPIQPGALNLARTHLTEVSMGRSNTHLFNRGIRFIVDEAERLGTIAPRGLVSLNFADPMGSARDLRNYLDNIPGLDTKLTDELMGSYLRADSEVGRARAVMSGFDQVSDALVVNTAKLNNLSDETSDALKDALRQATRIYDGGLAQVNNWWLRRYIADAKQSVATVNGEQIPLPGPQLEAELARGGIVLPQMRQLRDAVGRWGRYMEEGRGAEKLKRVRDVVGTMNDYWRSAVLLRPAYAIRNIGEMQSRMFLAGHSSVFSHPLAMTAFVVATRTNNPKIKVLAEKFTKANKTATGKDFTSVGVDELRDVDEAVELFAEATLARTSRLDMRTHRAMEAFHGLEKLTKGHPGFRLGWAEQLMTLRSSKLARIVAGLDPDEVARAVERGADRQDAIVNWVLSSEQARGLRQLFTDNDPSYSRIFGNPRLGVPGDSRALKQFLFTAEGSIANRINYFTRGSDELANFISTGLLRRGDSDLYTSKVDLTSGSAYAEEMMTRTRKLSQALKPYMNELSDEDALYMRVLRVGKGERPFQLFDGVFDWFFNWAGRMENAWSVGPEFAFAYHQKMAQLLPAIEKGSRQQVFDVIKGAEGRLRSITGETMRIARQGLKYDKDGMLTIEDASAMAARDASQHVKEFFYDAMRRNQFFHAMRVVWPFAQSFVDTLWRWGSLAAQRPYMMEKVGRLGMGLSEPGSNVIYDDFDYIDPFTNRQSYDPTQGFLYNDPQTGEQMLSFPIIGSALGQIMSPVAGAMIGEPVDLASAMQFKAPLRNLNIALQGDVDYLPGVGPLITFPMNVLMPDDVFGTFPEWLRSYIFPYGQLRFEEGIVEAGFFPTWARRLTGGLWNNEYHAYSIKGSMAHLLSTREYANFRSDPSVAEAFKGDVHALASSMAIIRAFGAAVLPAAPTQDIFAEDKDGGLIATGYLADRWHNMLDASGRDSEAAIAAMGETYGLATLAAIAGPSTEGDVPFSAAAWEFFKQNPKRGKAYSDVLGYFFPGDYSYEANSWIRATARRRTLSIAERTDNVVEFLFFAERRMIEGRAAQERWDEGAVRMAYDELEESYGGVTPTFEVGRVDQELNKIERALDKFPELAATHAGQGAQLIFETFNEHVEEAERRWGPGATLSSVRATRLRESFLADLDRIAAQYGGFNLETGSVDTIATMFARRVGEGFAEEEEVEE